MGSSAPVGKPAGDEARRRLEVLHVVPEGSRLPGPERGSNRNTRAVGPHGSPGWAGQHFGRLAESRWPVLGAGAAFGEGRTGLLL
jgi:hypothetical protein